MLKNQIIIGFVRHKSFYGKLASWLVEGPYHHTIVSWYDDNFQGYVTAEINPNGGIKLHSLENTLKKYKKDREFYVLEGVDKKEALPRMHKTLGWGYDLLLLICNFFRLLNYKWFGIVPNRKKRKVKKKICSEWAVELLKPFKLKYISNLVSHLTSPQHLRQAIIKNKNSCLIEEHKLLGN